MGQLHQHIFGCQLALDWGLLSVVHFPLLLNARSDKEMKEEEITEDDRFCSLEMSTTIKCHWHLWLIRTLLEFQLYMQKANRKNNCEINTCLYYELNYGENNVIVKQVSLKIIHRFMLLDQDFSSPNLHSRNNCM